MSLRTSGAVRLLLAALLFPLGALIGTAAVLVHQTWWGLPLAILSAAATARALPGGVLRLAFTFGWVLAVGAFALPRPAGDYLVASDLTGYALLVTALVLALAGLASWPHRSSPNEESEDTFPTMTP